MGKMELSPAERERRSLQAKKQHAEGKLGGPGRGQGRPKKVRASEYLSEQIAKDKRKIKDALWDSLLNGTRTEKMKAAALLLDLEGKESDREAREARDGFEEANREELIEAITKMAIALKAQGKEIPGLESIDGSATEVIKEQKQIEP